jgi:hypothetical protein
VGVGLGVLQPIAKTSTANNANRLITTTMTLVPTCG